VRFYLGTHMPHWLGLTDVPLFVSRRTLCRRKSLPRALGPWALDSGGFSELSMYGEWRTTAEQYVAEVRRYRDEIGNLEWAAIQDWMCEPFITAKTMPGVPHRMVVRWHQVFTVLSLRQLRDMAPDLPWAPVVQGWEERDYVDHVAMYAAEGFDLTTEPIVGVGSVCRRQGTHEAERIFRRLHGMGLRIHGFGVKTTGLARYHDALGSSDSLAWSFGARYEPPLPGHTHKSCANCLEYALLWRDRVLAGMERDQLNLLTWRAA